MLESLVAYEQADNERCLILELHSERDLHKDLFQNVKTKTSELAPFPSINCQLYLYVPLPTAYSVSPR